MQKGGSIHKDAILEKIISIGYELESGEVSPLRYVRDRHGLKFYFDNKDNELTSEHNTVFVQSTDTIDLRLNTSLTRFMAHTHSNAGKDYNLGYKEDKIVMLINPYEIPTDTQNILHTEFIKTYYSPSCVQDNILLSCFSNMLDNVISSFDGIVDRFPIMYNNPADTVRVLQYENNKGYALFNNKANPMKTLWVPQCTICVDITDIPSIIDYISVNNKYKTNLDVTLLDEELFDFHFNGSDLERGLAYLYAMFLSPKGKYSDFTIRHTWHEIIADIPLDSLDSNHPMRSYPEKKFKHVKQYEKPAPTLVLIELRTFSVQMKIFIKKILGLDIVSKGVNTLENMNIAVKTYLANPVAFTELLKEPETEELTDEDLQMLLEELV